MKVAQTKLKTLRHASPDDTVVRFEHRVVNKTKSFEVNNLQSGPPSVQHLDNQGRYLNILSEDATQTFHEVSDP